MCDRQAEGSTCSALGKGPWPHWWKCQLGFCTDTHVVPSNRSAGGPQRQGRAGGGDLLKCFQELCPAVCLSSSPELLHKATRTLMRPWICCCSLGKTWLGVWLLGFESVSLTPWSNSCSFAWNWAENQTHEAACSQRCFSSCGAVWAPPAKEGL